MRADSQGEGAVKQPGQEYSPELVPCAMCGVLEFKGRPPHGLDFCRAAIAGKPGPLAEKGPGK